MKSPMPGSDPTWDMPTRWKKLDRTPLGRMVKTLLIQWDRVMVDTAANDNAVEDHAEFWFGHLSLVADVLANDRTISRDNRRAIYRMAWKNRHLIPADDAVFAALGGGIPCAD